MSESALSRLRSTTRLWSEGAFCWFPQGSRRMKRTPATKSAEAAPTSRRMAWRYAACTAGGVARVVSRHCAHPCPCASIGVKTRKSAQKRMWLMVPANAARQCCVLPAARRGLLVFKREFGKGETIRPCTSSRRCFANSLWTLEWGHSIRRREFTGRTRAGQTGRSRAGPSHASTRR